jgi:benzoyl-CoA reductase/2-hydroxyglutaryl-CoA dehydratase subunit BcrC/BadD/HgdB
LPIYIPRGNRRSDVQYLAAEMRKKYDQLAQILDRHPSEEDLLSCTEREERADQVLGELLFERHALALSNRAFYALVRAREYLPSETFEDLGRTVLKQTEGGPRSGVPVLLSGLVVEPMTLLDALDDAGATVVADDMACTGRRVYPGGNSSDPFERMAQGLLGGPPDPTRGCTMQERRTHLVSLARKTGARGAIFLGIKFCEPELFYLPMIREGLQRDDVRSVSIEVDIADPLPDQVVTRLEAFVETIQ